MRRKIGLSELENIALGAAVLGTGGGGDPYIGKLMAAQAIREHGPVELVTVISEDRRLDDDRVGPRLVVALKLRHSSACIIEQCTAPHA